LLILSHFHPLHAVDVSHLGAAAGGHHAEGQGRADGGPGGRRSGRPPADQGCLSQ
jgi:hypothetical protein